MNIHLIGMNHRTAPIDVREQLAFSREGVSTALMLFHQRYPRSEAAIVSTCNRVEMLVVSPDEHPNSDDLISFIAQARDLPVPQFKPHLYQYQGEQAVRHLFRVAASLDSMVVGEYQIVNQLKAAFAQTSEEGTTGRVLNRLFHSAFGVSKRIRSETQIAARKVSIPSIAVDVAQSIFSDLSDKRVLVVGAGEMAQLICTHLRKAQARQFVVTSRTLNNARTLAQACQGQAVPYSELDAQLAQADLVIAATSCPKPIITTARIREAQKHRHGRPMFVIDLAVPRNVEPEVERVNQVYVYDVDALGRIAAENQQHRQAQLPLCETILDEEIAAFQTWLQQTASTPMIEQVFTDARQLRDVEIARLLAACPDLTEQERKAVNQLADRLINKLMHPCVVTMREHGQSSPVTMLADAIHDVTVKACQTWTSWRAPETTRGSTAS
ncbi:MAG: glutamyl-tRNA reductase [Phycisphaeraceae bacterium]